ncbi:Ig-like domain-containing protein [Enterococcus pseudoavium]|uniref:Ig-like domain-containing protein n=1 Tax=Enterococcus pseudoavium TaxID=44007 RepID=A0AAE4I5N6_9ENTE|nr:Ig-like domain-containing protein [Enterococcus pseudoavium]MDT2738101.1 Ig-like domain-containing protein [Enterococcus pseudoavium]
MNKTTTSLVVGANETLTATVLPADATDKTVTWKSSDAAKVTVDAQGKLVAVAAGTADITVTTKDGSKTAKCTVTVTAV